jgi:hypothetical protein
MTRPLFYQQTKWRLVGQKINQRLPSHVHQAIGTSPEEKRFREATELSFCCPLPPLKFYVKMLLSKLENEIFSLHQT